MKKIVLGILIISNSVALFSQKTFIDGMPISVVDGSTKVVTGNIDTQNFDGLRLSDDGTKLFAYKELFKQIFIIDVATNNVTDTLSFTNNVWDFIPGTSNFLYYSENPTSFIYKLDITTKMVVDSISLNQGGSSYLRRRPGTNEIWTTKENQLYYFTLSDMTLNFVNSGFSASAWLNTLEFNGDGSLVYFFAKPFGQDGELKKMDATTKMIIGTLTTENSKGNLKYFVPSDDDATFYVDFWGVWPNEPSKIMLGDISTMTIIDSLNLPHKPFDLFEHPNGNELWVVYHYDAKIGVLDRTNNLVGIDSIDVGINPKNILFTNIITAVNIDNQENKTWNLYPNPSHGKFNLNSDKEIVSVTVYNVLGKQVLSEKINANEAQINLADLPKGMYVINVVFNEGSLSKKVILE